MKKRSSIPDNKIEINNSRTGRLYIHGAKAVIIQNSEVEDISHYNYGQDILLKSCTIKKKDVGIIRKGLTMKKCK